MADVHKGTPNTLCIPFVMLLMALVPNTECPKLANDKTGRRLLLTPAK